MGFLLVSYMHPLTGAEGLHLPNEQWFQIMCSKKVWDKLKADQKSSSILGENISPSGHVCSCQSSLAMAQQRRWVSVFSIHAGQLQSLAGRTAALLRREAGGAEPSVALQSLLQVSRFFSICLKVAVLKQKKSSRCICISGSSKRILLLFDI